MNEVSMSPSTPGVIKNHAAFIWSVADLLRGDYKQSEYGKVILPLTVIRRLSWSAARSVAESDAHWAMPRRGKLVPDFPLLAIHRSTIALRSHRGTAHDRLSPRVTRQN
jgi:hypothetical protein